MSGTVLNMQRFSVVESFLLGWVAQTREMVKLLRSQWATRYVKAVYECWLRSLGGSGVHDLCLYT